jgi:hypothetical protein
VRYAANTNEEMQKLLRSYRDNMRVEIEPGIAVTASTLADLRALPTWPNGLVLNIHVDLDPRFSVVQGGTGVLIQPCLSAASRRRGQSRNRTPVSWSAKPLSLCRLMGLIAAPSSGTPPKPIHPDTGALATSGNGAGCVRPRTIWLTPPNQRWPGSRTFKFTGELNGS